MIMIQILTSKLDCFLFNRQFQPNGFTMEIFTGKYDSSSVCETDVFRFSSTYMISLEFFASASICKNNHTLIRKQSQFQ